MATHIPIVLIDMAGFSRLKAVPEQRGVLARFEEMLAAGLKRFIGFGDPRKIFGWHGTGDGYYITMEGFPTEVALGFAMDLEETLQQKNRQHPDYPLRLRIGLVVGDVERVGSQWLSQAYTEATRLVDHGWTKSLLEKCQERATVLVASTLFMDDWHSCIEKGVNELTIPPLPPWTRVDFSIKHGETLAGYLHGEPGHIEAVIREKVVLTDAPVNPQALLHPWLRRMVNENCFIKVGGIGAGRGQGKEVLPYYPIEDLYTVLRSRGGGPRQEEMGKEEGPKNLAELLPHHHRLLIEGQAGTGKTTFLQLTFTMLARDTLGEVCPDGTSWRSRYLGLLDKEKPRIPLLLKLSRLVGKNRKNRGLLLDLLVEEMKDETGEQQTAWRQGWDKRLQAGEVMLLLDGLDEVADLASREDLRLVFMDMINHWGKCPMVVTSRPYLTEFLKPLGFHPATIEPFDNDGIEEFLDRWVTVLHGLPVDQAPDGGDMRRQLERAIVQRPEIRTMATNPVMLTCLCVVHWNEGRLPDGRSRVYQAVTTWLRRARQTLREQAGFNDRFAETAFLQLALAMMGGAGGAKRATLGKTDAGQAIRDAVARNFPQLAGDPLLKAGEWLAFEAIWSGIIEDTGRGEVRFWHLTFQEYLAARQLTQLANTPENQPGWWPILQKNLTDPQWRETVVLFPGCLFDANGETAVDNFLQLVLADRSIDRISLADDARIAGIIGRVLQPMAVYGYQASPTILVNYRQVLERAMAIFTIEGAMQVPIDIRIEAAEAIGQAGDPRLKQDNLLPIPGTQWLLGKYLVTVAEYQDFVEEGGYQERRWWDEAGWQKWESPDRWDNQLIHPNRPVTGVSWFEATAYCRWLSEQKKMIIRLPDEGIWVKAIKGTYPWGEAEPSPELANFAPDWNPNVGSPTPVGIYPAGDGPSGHCDLAGNVWEWQRNLYENKNATDTPMDVLIADSNNELTVRGGSWDVDAGFLRAAARNRFHAEGRDVGVGFRLAAAPASTLVL